MIVRTVLSCLTGLLLVTVLIAIPFFAYDIISETNECKAMPGCDKYLCFADVTSSGEDTLAQLKRYEICEERSIQ